MTDADNVHRQGQGRPARGLLVISVLAAALMVIAAVNLILVFVLLNNHRQIGGPGTDRPTFLPYLALGVLPFLVTAALIAWTALGARAANEAGKARQHIVDRLIAINVIALPLMAVCGFWAGLFAAALVLPAGSPEAGALYIYQFTLVAAVVADGVTVVAALVTRGGLGRNP
jgi:hypothetical protein